MNALAPHKPVIDPAIAAMGINEILVHNACHGPQKTGARRLWTTREIDLLRRHYPAGGLEACLVALPGRTAKSVTAKASELGIGRLLPGDVPRRPRQAYPHSPAIDEAIRRCWQAAPDFSAIRSLSRTLNRPVSWLRRRATTLGLIVPRFRPLDWSEAEIAILRQCVGRHPATPRKRIKAELGIVRSLNAIMLKRRHLGLLAELDDGHETCASLAQCFGVGVACVSGWVERGLIKADDTPRQWPGTARTDKVRRWRFTEAAVRAFVRDNVGLIDFRKVDKFWLVALLTAEGPRHG